MRTHKHIPWIETQISSQINANARQQTNAHHAQIHQSLRHPYAQYLWDIQQGNDAQQKRKDRKIPQSDKIQDHVLGIAVVEMNKIRQNIRCIRKKQQPQNTQQPQHIFAPIFFYSCL